MTDAATAVMNINSKRSATQDCMLWLNLHLLWFVLEQTIHTNPRRER